MQKNSSKKLLNLKDYKDNLLIEHLVIPTLIVNHLFDLPPRQITLIQLICVLSYCAVFIESFYIITKFLKDSEYHISQNSINQGLKF